MKGFILFVVICCIASLSGGFICAFAYWKFSLGGFAVCLRAGLAIGVIGGAFLHGWKLWNE